MATAHQICQTLDSMHIKRTFKVWSLQQTTFKKYTLNIMEAIELPMIIRAIFYTLFKAKILILSSYKVYIMRAFELAFSEQVLPIASHLFFQYQSHLDPEWLKIMPKIKISQKLDYFSYWDTTKPQLREPPW